jgi:hypothetical protein
MDPLAAQAVIVLVALFGVGAVTTVGVCACIRWRELDVEARQLRLLQPPIAGEPVPPVQQRQRCERCVCPCCTGGTPLSDENAVLRRQLADHALPEAWLRRLVGAQEEVVKRSGANGVSPSP